MSSMIAAQLYTLREHTKTPADIAKTMQKVAALGYRAVQASALGPIEPEELRRICDGEGLTICSTHTSFDRMREEPEQVIEEHQILGCPYPAIGGMPQEYRNPEGYHRFARDASEVGGRLAEAGLTFGYHNHSFELERFGEKTGLEIIYSESDPQYVQGEIDTYWIQHGGGSPVAWINRLQGRLPLLHLKDMAVVEGQPTMAEVGEGNLDWPAILEAAARAGVKWYIVEQDICRRDPFESLKISLENLKAWGLS